MSTVKLNLGCGFRHKPGYINVDKHDNCEPDVVHDLNAFPYPWPDDSVDEIVMFHVLEHLIDWWGSLDECARILKPGASIEIRVPDASNDGALSCRDHNHVFSPASFSGIIGGPLRATNAEAMLADNTIPLHMVGFYRVPEPRYWWMSRWPFKWLLTFCADHLRNFIWEQQFVFVKIGDRNE
jgi:SAM-dependent methyltransferase